MAVTDCVEALVGRGRAPRATRLAIPVWNVRREIMAYSATLGIAAAARARAARPSPRTIALPAPVRNTRGNRASGKLPVWSLMAPRSQVALPVPRWERVLMAAIPAAAVPAGSQSVASAQNGPLMA